MSQLAEIPRQVPDVFHPLIMRVGGVRRALILLVGVAAAGLILLLANVANRPTFVPAFSGIPLEQSGRVTERLESEKIPYRLEAGGTQIQVPAGDLARARVALAQDGLPSAGRPGLELFDQPSWGMTDFTQRVNYRRALEGELERTISKMRGIEAAQVHLALRETAGFRRGNDRPAEASVVLKLMSGATPPPDVVQGIAHLTASSVDGLESNKVTVLDEGGRLLSTPDEPGSLTGLTSRQLSVQREVEQHLEKKAEQILSQLVGPGNSRVQISAAVNFDRVERTVQSVDPERQALVTEQKAEIIPGAEGGAGSTNTANSYETSRSVETVSGAIGNVQRLTVAVLVNEPPLAVPTPDGDDDVVPAARVASPDLAQVEALVRAAVGVDPARGDQVSVVKVPFAPVFDVTDAPLSTWERVETVQKPILTALALLLVFVVALVGIRALRPTAVSELAAASAPRAIGLPTDAAALTAGAMQPSTIVTTAEPIMVGSTNDDAPAAALAADAPRVLSPGQILRDRVVVSVESDPDIAARLVRNWLRES